jgi:predicted nucleic acid-binding protein
MVNYADTGFFVSLYLEEVTSERARTAVASLKEPIALTPLLRLEMRNAFNLAVCRKRITAEQRDAHLTAVEEDVASGVLLEAVPPGAELYREAVALSDRYTPTLATRSLDLLHVAAAALLGAKVFFSFDERQRRAAAGEGMKVKPSSSQPF